MYWYHVLKWSQSKKYGWSGKYFQTVVFLVKFREEESLKDYFSFFLSHPVGEYHKKLEIRVHVNDNIHHLHHNIKHLCCNTVSPKVVHTNKASVYVCVYVLYTFILGRNCNDFLLFDVRLLSPFFCRSVGFRTDRIYDLRQSIFHTYLYSFTHLPLHCNSFFKTWSHQHF